jgi:seryl-tRNA synthetase
LKRRNKNIGSKIKKKTVLGFGVNVMITIFAILDNIQRKNWRFSLKTM